MSIVNLFTRQLFLLQRISNFRNASSTSATDYASLLLPDQRQRCMEQMRNLSPNPRPKMAPSKRELKSASVLIALCVDRDTKEISILYTRRSRHLRNHSMQISFPGGQRDPNDVDFVQCALRETEEEIGLPRERVVVWGDTALMRFPRTAAIMPVVGVIPDFHISQLQLNSDEVEDALAIPLRELITPTAVRHTQFRAGYSAPVFVVGHNRVWGITAYLTFVFLRCLFPPEAPLPPQLRTNIKYVRPYKVPPKPPTNNHHHHHHHNHDSISSSS